MEQALTNNKGMKRYLITQINGIVRTKVENNRAERMKLDISESTRTQMKTIRKHLTRFRKYSITG